MRYLGDLQSSLYLVPVFGFTDPACLNLQVVNSQKPRLFRLTLQYMPLLSIFQPTFPYAGQGRSRLKRWWHLRFQHSAGHHLPWDQEETVWSSHMQKEHNFCSSKTSAEVSPSVLKTYPPVVGLLIRSERLGFHCGRFWVFDKEKCDGKWRGFLERSSWWTRRVDYWIITWLQKWRTLATLRKKG